jgi:hypothetical protein
MRSPVRLRLAALAIFACALHCAELPRIESGTCGNGVVDPEEDCDTFPVADPDAAATATGKKLACGTTGASACRYVCTTSAECPDGWGCGTTGICRAPTGVFPRASEPISAGAVSLVAGDFDGDGRKDVIALGPRNVDSSARARVHYFADGAKLDHVTALAAPLASPAVRDFDGDGLDDFAFGAGGLGAFGIMTGQADRTFVPVMFPLVRFPGVDVKPVQVLANKGGPDLPTGSRSAFLLAGRVTGQSLSGTLLFSGSTAKGDYTHKLDVGPEGINGFPVFAALFDKDATSACGEVLLATSAGSIQIFSPCKPDTAASSAWASDRAPVTVSGMDPASTVFVADVDADGHADLVYRSAAKKNTLVVAHGDGLGFPASGVVEGGLPGGDVPLAAQDLNGDGYPDFVTPTAFIASSTPDGGAGPVTYTTFVVQQRARWTAARIGNFNGDAYPDIIAASAEQPDIDFLSGLPGASFASSTIPTDGPVSVLTSGDLDGDTLTDVLFVEGKAGSSTTDVSVAYARPFGPPEEPRPIGRLPDIAFVDPVFGPPPTSLAIFLRSKSPSGDPTLAIAFAAGSGDRLPLAPLFLDDRSAEHPLVVGANGATDRRWSPVSVHAGSFVDPSRVDLLGVAIGYTFTNEGQPVLPFPTGLWAAAGTGPTEFSSAVDLGDLDLPVDAVDPKTLASLLPTDSGDVDGDGLLDLVTIGKGSGQAAGAAPPRLIVSRFGGSSPQVDVVPLPADVTVDGASLTRLLDVDGDGALDVVALLGDASSGNTGGSTILVILNDGAGGFGAAPLPVALPPLPADAKRTDSGPRGFDQITTGAVSASGAGKATRQLAIVTQRRLLLASLRADRSGFDVTDTEAAGLQGATGIVAADVDGDGVQDLAIADNGALRVLRQKALHDKETP